MTKTFYIITFTTLSSQHILTYFKKSLKEKRKEEEETTKLSWTWRFMSGVPATEEAKTGGSLETRCWRLAWQRRHKTLLSKTSKLKLNHQIVAKLNVIQSKKKGKCNGNLRGSQELQVSTAHPARPHTVLNSQLVRALHSRASAARTAANRTLEENQDLKAIAGSVGKLAGREACR